MPNTPSARYPTARYYTIFGLDTYGDWTIEPFVATSVEGIKRYLSNNPNWMPTPLAYAEDADDPDFNPSSLDCPEDFFAYTYKLILTGHQLSTSAVHSLGVWAALNFGSEDLARIAREVKKMVGCELELKPQAPPGPRRPPRTVIVQDWMRETASSEAGRAALIERAWQATKAICGG